MSQVRSVTYVSGLDNEIVGRSGGTRTCDPCVPNGILDLSPFDFTVSFVLLQTRSSRFVHVFFGEYSGGNALFAPSISCS
jgi:hypothetical protein